MKKQNVSPQVFCSLNMLQFGTLKNVFFFLTCQVVFLIERSAKVWFHEEKRQYGMMDGALVGLRAKPNEMKGAIALFIW